MTWFECRAYAVLWVAKLLRIRMRDLHDSYPYNPLSGREVAETYKNATIRTQGTVLWRGERRPFQPPE